MRSIEMRNDENLASMLTRSHLSSEGFFFTLVQWDIYWYLFDERWLCNGQSFVALFFWLEQSGNHVCIGLTESAIRLAWVCLG